jgi:hypothetical protein
VALGQILLLLPARCDFYVAIYSVLPPFVKLIESLGKLTHSQFNKKIEESVKVDAPDFIDGLLDKNVTQFIFI